MSITEQGIQGEKKAMILFKGLGFNMFQSDWIITDKYGKDYIIEVKHKEPFSPPPFEGQGLNIKQVQARMLFQKRTGIRCIFFTINPKNEKVYWQFLDKLEYNKNYYDTQKGIRIYPLSEFNTDQELNKLYEGTPYAFEY